MIQIKEVDQSCAVTDEKWGLMRRDLKKTRKALQLSLEQLVNMRKEQVAYKILLERELGVDPKGLLPYKPRRKDRSCETTYLKSELTSLVSHLQTLDPKLCFDPNALPSTSMEVLLTEQQMKDLVVLYQNYNVYRSENERKAAEAFRDYLQMRNEYETALLHNNAMMEEINGIRKKIKELKTQAKEDKCFMKFLVTFQLSPEPPSVVQAETPSYAIAAIKNDSQMQKYKSLWKSNLQEKAYVHQCVESLEQRLEDTHRQIVVAENVCMDNGALLSDLEQKVEEEEFSTLEQHNGGTDDSFRRLYWGVSGELTAALQENQFIRHFLQRNVLPREKDFRKLLSSLEAKAAEYRTKIVEATPPEPVVEAQPEPKAKATKKGKKLK